ncbi:protein enabled homolog [Palaemon carinicauda]|uniref:protein enabled homolog n=1 Tax=Palaemon carinicauda TaxID=392227 RepID=UPI0035B57430
MRLTLVIFLLAGTAAVLVSGQRGEQRRLARQRFRALQEAARSGDTEAQSILQSRRRQRARTVENTVQSTPVPRRPVFQNAAETPVENKPVRVRIPVRGNRVRVAQPEATTFHPPTQVFTITTQAPEPVFPDTEESVFSTDPFTEAPFFEHIVTDPVTEAPVIHNEIISRRPTRPQSRRVVQSRPSDDFNVNFDHEPHKALNSGLEIDSRSEHIIPRFGNDRTTEPPVETIRRYSYFDEEGSYVFGYEAADGSFKEEVRRLDCVVDGKYGYVDPEGIRREFTYTSGNKCDPNAVADPETQEFPTLPLNDQFLQQTKEQPLSQDQLEQLQFNRRRKPVQNTQPEVQTPVRANRRQRPSPRTTSQQTFRPVPVQQQVQRVQQQQQVREPAFPEAFEEPINVTPAPAPVFTTPPSFNRFTTPPSLRPATQQQVRRPQPISIPEEEEVHVSQPTRAPVQEPSFQPTTHQAFRPPEGPSFRPTPKPIAFDFDREFNQLFNNFAAPRPTTRRPVFTTPRPITRPPPPPTTRPPPPPPTTRPPPPPPPPTTSPVSHFSLDDGSQTLTGGSDVANQLVFDAASGTFTNVKVKTGSSSSFLPRPAPNPFAPQTFAATPTLASRPPPPPPATFTAATRPPPPPTPSASTVGRPLPLPNFNPASHFVINQNGRSPAAAEFDKFFSQFNLKF